MITRSYHIRIEIKPTLKQKSIDDGQNTVITCIIEHKSWFAKPDVARLGGFHKIIEENEGFTVDNCTPVSFTKC